MSNNVTVTNPSTSTGAVVGAPVNTNPTRAVVTAKSVGGAVLGALLASVGALVPHVSQSVQTAFIGAGGGTATLSLLGGMWGHVELALGEIEHGIATGVGRVTGSPVVQQVEKDLGVTPITQQEVDARAKAVAIDVVSKVFPGYDVQNVVDKAEGTTPQV